MADMPLFEFRCERCGGTVEEIRPISAMDEPCACPKCSREVGYMIRAERVISAPAPQFPGAASWRGP
jgi:putative FmdB family regulatory protein